MLGRHSACISFFSITFFHNWTSYKLKLSGIFKNLIGIVILVITFCDAVISHVITSFLLFQLHCWYQEVFKRCCHTQNLEEIEEHYLPLVNKPVCDIQNMFSRNNNVLKKKLTSGKYQSARTKRPSLEGLDDVWSTILIKIWILSFIKIFYFVIVWQLIFKGLGFTRYLKFWVFGQIPFWRYTPNQLYFKFSISFEK